MSSSLKKQTELLGYGYPSVKGMVQMKCFTCGSNYAIRKEKIVIHRKYHSQEIHAEYKCIRCGEFWSL